MVKISSILVAIISIMLLSIGYDWGLPGNERAKVLFSDRNEHNSMVDLLTTNYKLQKEKTGDKIYIDNYTKHVKSMEYDESINMSLARFLIVPYAADDAFVLKAIKNLNPSKYDFDPNYYMYGGGLVYMSAIALKMSEIIGYVKLKPNIAFYLENPEMMGRMYKVLRFLILVFSVIGIVIVYLYTVKNHGQWPAIITLLFMLINPESIASSHAIEPHMYVLPFFSLSLYYSYKYYISGSLTNDYILASIFAGLSIGTQASSMYIVVPIIITTLVSFYKKTRSYDLFVDLLLYFILLTATVLLINPYYVLNMEGFLQDINVGLGNQLTVSTSESSVSLENIWAPYQISTFLLTIFILAIPYNFFILRKKGGLFYMGVTIPAIVIYMMTGNVMQYIYPSLMVFSIISSLMIVDIYKKIFKSSRKYFVFFILIFAMLSPVSRSIYYLINYKYDNRIVAAEWVNKNIKVGSSIGVTFPPTNYDSIPFRFHKYNLNDISLINRDSGIPEYIILVNRDIPIDIRENYKLIKEFTPKTIFGYMPVLKGEVAAIYAKIVRIYSIKS